ncbi:YrrS family protein [Halobacillus rhizosphaerae]|uniref:YrrS family protein n=1 Tax=Halobacillus rhizosphaerae TaxID=3064889 RepID=UPI00398B8FD5
MPDNKPSNSRTDRFENRRKWKRIMAVLTGLAALVVVVFLSLVFFGGDDSAGSAEPSSQSSQSADQKSDSDSSSTDSSDSNGEKNNASDNTDENNNSSEDSQSDESKNSDGDQKDKSQKDKNSGDDLTVEEDSSDSNVERVIKKDWKPVATKQKISGDHSVNWSNDDSQDWQELLQAVSEATGIPANSMITWWVDGNGPQKVVATVSDDAEKQTYRVHVEWVEGKGYKPTMLEALKSNKYK